MKSSDILMGQLPKSWGENGNTKTITFCVTEDCNLACKYCYLVGKNTRNKMTLDTAKRAVDYFLEDREFFKEKSIIWDFMGGEPFIEIDLIDKITDYIKEQTFLKDHPWFNSYRLSFSTNGLLYKSPQVQRYIEKNRSHISIGISIDGNKVKHDMQRVKPDGSGSYDDVMENVRLWMKQLGGDTTKATFSHDDLPHLKDSIIHLWEQGIKMVAANVVFEDVWHEGDNVIFEKQLEELADYVIENRLWNDYSVRFFDPSIGFPNDSESLNRNYCGTGQMLAVDYKGDLFPCVRFCDYSLGNKKGYVVGNIYKGINRDKLRGFEVLSLKAQSKEECINCEVASGCAWCSGNNYDAADSNTIFQRTTFQCEMHKANVRAAQYFWDRYKEVTGLVSPREQHKNRKAQQNKVEAYLMIMTSDNITPHCSYKNWNNTNNITSREIIEQGLEFASKNGYEVAFLGRSANVDDNVYDQSISIDDAAKNPHASMPVFTDVSNGLSTYSDSCILRINKNNMPSLFERVTNLMNTTGRINISIEDLEIWEQDDIDLYDELLWKLLPLILETYNNSEPIEINVLTDILAKRSMFDCDAGNNTFTLAPNGKLYICPAFYFNDPDDAIGDLINGINMKNRHLLELEYAPICSSCDAYHCKRCKFLNMKLTNEINIPSKIQCVVSHVERNKSRELYKMLKSVGIEPENMPGEIDYLDPLDNLRKFKKAPVYTFSVI